MRYKITVATSDAFERALSIAQSDTDVFVSLPRRGVLSTGRLSEKAQRKLVELGATVNPETQYDMET